MPPPESPVSGRAVPSGRLSRLARFGGMAGGIAGNMLIGGARQLAAGQRPSVGGLLLTPANAARITRQLADLRGAAMKIGQLLSMDSGELLPPELADILGRLRADGQHMPPKQLEAVLDRNWGKGWRLKFQRFDVRPIAAASIGQVHRAQTKDGRDLAIKVQYPGIRSSIDSDVDNVAVLMRLSGLVPKSIDVAPMLAEAKRQLHEEADYAREAGCLGRFGDLLAGSPDYQVPALHADLTTSDVLAMAFVEGAPVEALADAPQAERDRITSLLIALVLRELFEFGLMQTDPNFANYRYNRATGRLVLLDFGATRAFSAEVASQYHALMVAGMAGDGTAARAAMIAIGFFADTAPPQHQASILAMFEAAFAPLRADGGFDFAGNGLAAQIRDKGMALATDRDFWHLPPIDTLFLQRKFAGVFLLGSRLQARVDMRGLMAPYL